MHKCSIIAKEKEEKINKDLSICGCVRIFSLKPEVANIVIYDIFNCVIIIMINIHTCIIIMETIIKTIFMSDSQIFTLIMCNVTKLNQDIRSSPFISVRVDL